MMLFGFSVSGNNKPARFSCRPTLPVLRASGVVEGPRTILMARRSESKRVLREKPAGSQVTGQLSPRPLPGVWVPRSRRSLGGLRLGKGPFKPASQGGAHLFQTFCRLCGFSSGNHSERHTQACYKENDPKLLLPKILNPECAPWLGGRGNPGSGRQSKGCSHYGYFMILCHYQISVSHSPQIHKLKS